MVSRARFGTAGWSDAYDFNLSDLSIGRNVIYNYLARSPHDVGSAATPPQDVPWDQLQYVALLFTLFCVYIYWYMYNIFQKINCFLLFL